MSNIIPNAVWVQVMAAIRDTTDSLCIHPVSYFLASYPTAGGSMDRFNEDRGDIVAEPFVLNCLVEYGEAVTNIAEIISGGALERDEVKLTFNFQYLEEQNLTIGKLSKFNENTDYVVIDEVKYKVSAVYYDGPIQDYHALVIVKAKIDQSTNE